MADWAGVAADLDLRKLRYFVVTAEALNFSRAAEALHIAQPVLTRQIRALEHDLGVVLFDRSSRGTALSTAGEAVLAEAQALLRSSLALRRHARRAERGGHLVVAFMPGVAPSRLLLALREDFPELAIDVVRTSWDDQVEVIQTGRADLSFVRLPIDRDGLLVTPVFAEPRVAAVAAIHPLAARLSLGLDDLTGLPLLQDPTAVPELHGTHAAVTARPQPTMEEKLERVAIDGGFVIVPESTALAYPRADVVLRRVDGLAPSEVALVCSAAAVSASPVLGAAMELAKRWDALGEQP